MRKNKLMTMFALIALLCAASVAAIAQNESGLNCNNRGNKDRGSHCLIKEQTVAATGGTLNIDGKKNGGVSVKGWERKEVLVRAQIQTWANTDEEARILHGQIRIQFGGSSIYAEGPETQNKQGWSVSFEVFVPQNSSLSLKAHNGGISVADVRGNIDFSTTNGGVSLKRLAGHVKGETRNGGVTVELAGNRWDGEGVDVRTTNGGVKLVVPENYSARLETGTVNGHVSVDFPITVQGEIKRELSVNLGSGGAMIRVATTNGGVAIKRKA